MSNWFSRLLKIGPRQTEQRTPSSDSHVDAIRAVLPASNANLEQAAAFRRQGNEKLAENRLTEAENCYRQALALNPGDAAGHVNLGYVLADLGRTDEASAVLRRGLELDPKLEDGWFILGRLAALAGHHREAVGHFEEAARIRPAFPEALEMLGDCYWRIGESEQRAASSLGDMYRFKAIECFRQAAHADKRPIGSLISLGNALAWAQRFPEAEQAFSRCLAIEPSNEQALVGLGKLYMAVGQDDDALDRFEAALTVDPWHPEALDYAETLYRRHGFRESALDCCQRRSSLNPDVPALQSNLVLLAQYDPELSPGGRFGLALGYAERFESSLKAHWRPHNNDRNPDRRIRIGYLSPDFRFHSVTFFLLPVLKAHDRSQFEVVCYHDTAMHDSVTAEVAALADRFIPCHTDSNDQLADRIRMDEIDILVDLDGHFANNRLTVFARKPAPVQASWLGYPATTGLSAMDYRITDVHLDPPGLTEAIHSETLVRLPIVAGFDPPDDSPEVNNLPARTAGIFTFASMNNLLKLNDRVIGLWSKILLQVPHARLMIGNVNSEGAKSRIVSTFARYGIAEERLALRPSLSLHPFLALHHEIDLALDPSPFGGLTTSFQHVWMGVPVLTLAGPEAISRLAASVMSILGCPEFIANSDDDYIDKAVELSKDVEKLGEVRGGLRERVAALSSRREGAAMVHELEAAYRRMWQTYALRGSKGA